jgi:hypothetical protein
MTSGAWIWSHLLLWVGAAAGITGVAGLCLRHWERLGRTGGPGAGDSPGLPYRDGSMASISWVRAMLANPTLVSPAP